MRFKSRMPIDKRTHVLIYCPHESSRPFALVVQPRQAPTTACLAAQSARLPTAAFSLRKIISYDETQKCGGFLLRYLAPIARSRRSAFRPNAPHPAHPAAAQNRKSKIRANSCAENEDNANHPYFTAPYSLFDHLTNTRQNRQILETFQMDLKWPKSSKTNYVLPLSIHIIACTTTAALVQRPFRIIAFLALSLPRVETGHGTELYRYGPYRF